MPSTKDMIQSKYLKGSDVPDPVIVTVQWVKQANVARDDQEPEYKWTIKFNEFPKAMVLNATNIRIAEKALGTNTDEWTGKEIELHYDENVTFGNELVGGLRFRRKQAPAKKLTIDEANKKLAEMQDDAPF